VYHKLQIQNSCNTIYPRNMVCFRYMTVNSFHEGDNDDDDDYDDDDDDDDDNNNNKYTTKSRNKIYLICL